MTMSGLYALFDLDGGPVDRTDLAVLGLDAPISSAVAAASVDHIAPDATHSLADGERTTLFLGYIDEPLDLADQLGVTRSMPVALLARTALDRFRTALPAHMLGDWLMLDYDTRGSVTMLVGIGGRMPLLYAHVGKRLAIAPSIHVLSRLGWVGRDIDDDAFLLSLTRCTLDDERRTRGILRGIRSVPRGGCVTVSKDGRTTMQIVDPFVAVPRWTGSRDEAMEAAEGTLRHIVGQQLRRSPKSGLLLSGGLDSSLVAWALAAEGGKSLPALSSAVVPGRGVPDETAFAAIVADTLGMPLHRVVPSADASVYRPSGGTLRACNFPPLSPRDYVYAAFANTARAMGIGQVFDGAHGELTFTALMPVLAWTGWPRHIAREARDRMRARLNARDAAPFDEVFNVALSRDRRKAPGPALVEAVAAEHHERWFRRAGEPWGYSAGARPPLRRDAGELRAGQLRLVRPFHDIRLLRLFAGFPAEFMVGKGMTRWPARAVLTGRLPETITLRQSGMPFSPDYGVRLIEQVPSALARIAEFRRSGCDEWFDLEWLSDGLGRVASGRSHDLTDTFRIQLTAHACEFLTWWRAGGSESDYDSELDFAEPL